jgi:hypothetical protein
MKTYIAYFDFLGYKQFILNNENEHIRRRIGHILRDLEYALGLGKHKEAQYGVIADISKSNLHCLNISDTIILWTKDDSIESLQELLDVCFIFNYREVRYNFPARGAIVYGEIDLISHFYESEQKGTYNINSVYGKGLVNAHLIAESLNLSGCIIDNSAIEKIKEFENWEVLIEKYAVLYNVPHKDDIFLDEFIFRLYENKTINEETFKNSSNGIESTFTADTKGMSERAKELLNNTISFLKSFVE